MCIAGTIYYEKIRNPKGGVDFLLSLQKAKKTVKIRILGWDKGSDKDRIRRRDR